MMNNKFTIFLKHPLAGDVELDSSENVACVSKIIQSKPFLKKVYQQWYKDIIKLLPTNVNGSVLELGSGAGFLEKYYPNLLKSEILKISNVDVVLDATELPFKNNTLRGIVMIDVLHHLPDVESFFREASRSLRSNGAIIMIEPWVTFWSKFVYRRFHHEPFEDKVDDWSLPKGGPLSHANSALPWIIFHRDKKKFIGEFSDIEIKTVELHTPFVYLLSGGVSMRNFIPGFFYRPLKYFERTLNPWIDFCAMFATIVLSKKGI